MRLAQKFNIQNNIVNGGEGVVPIYYVHDCLGKFFSRNCVYSENFHQKCVSMHSNMSTRPYYSVTMILRNRRAGGSCKTGRAGGILRNGRAGGILQNGRAGGILRNRASWRDLAKRASWGDLAKRASWGIVRNGPTGGILCHRLCCWLGHMCVQCTGVHCYKK